MNSPLVNIYISCVPGLESVLQSECHALGFHAGSQDAQETEGSAAILGERGGVLFSGTVEQVMLGNLHLRTASRILIRFAEFYASAFSELDKKTARLDWARYLTPGKPVNIRVTCHKSKLYHSDAVAERVLNSINRALTGSTGVKKPVVNSKDGQTVMVRLFHDLCTISIDSSGELLHRRGYHLETAKAPIRETLAAGLILSTGWNGCVPLLDPFCGSGTIPIEAALIAQRIPPGMGRKFAFMDWPGFNRSVWEEQLEDARSKIIHPGNDILGFDRDTGAISAAISNASRAGQKNEIIFKQQPISLLEPTPSAGWIITNPPYGVRVSANKDLRDLYARFGTILRSKFEGWKLGILCNDPILIGNLGIGQPEKSINLVNGGIPVKFSTFLIS